MCFWKSIIGDDMDRFDPPKFIECDIDDHLEAFESTRKLRSFVFRGHRESNWELSSSFFREYEKYPKNQVMESAERMTIDYFKKRHHLYQLGLQGAPDLKDILASMQHHGCPTRLIDFTKSFSVATYFAVNDAAFNGNPYSIWAVNLPVIKCASVAAIGSTFDFEKTFFAFPQTNPLSVLAFEPSMLSRRMSTQQGILLVQMNIRETFLKNLCSMAKISEVPVKINYDDYKSIDQNSINNVAITVVSQRYSNKNSWFSAVD